MKRARPLTGATVTVKSTGNSATSNDKGSFTLQVPNGNATLVVSYVGFLHPGIAGLITAQLFQ